MDVCRPLNTTEFVALNISVRNSRLKRSRIGIRLSINPFRPRLEPSRTTHGQAPACVAGIDSAALSAGATIRRAKEMSIRIATALFLFIAIFPATAQQFVISTYAGGNAAIGSPQGVAADTAGNV